MKNFMITVHYSVVWSIEKDDDGNGDGVFFIISRSAACIRQTGDKNALYTRPGFKRNYARPLVTNYSSFIRRF